METVSEPERVHESANKHLRRGVLSANSRHQGAATLWTQPIHFAAVGRLLADGATEKVSRSSFWCSKASLACEVLSQARAHALQ